MTNLTEAVPAVEDRWRYGWRYRREIGPDGEVRFEQIPLKKEDLLHPQEGDFIVETDFHGSLCIYLKASITAVMAGRPGYHVLFDVRVDWGVAGVEPHGPDISAFANVAGWNPRRGTFRVAKLGAAPLAVIEVTSENTRDNDFGPKLVEYHQVGIPVYIIIDLHPLRGEPSPQLHGYQWTPDGYQPLPQDDAGRIRIESLGLSIGVEGEEVVCFGPDGSRLAQVHELIDNTKAAEAKAQAAQADAQAAEAKTQAAEAKAQAAQADAQAARAKLKPLRPHIQAATEAARAEAAARAAAEDRLRDLQVEVERLRKLKDKGKNGD